VAVVCETGPTIDHDQTAQRCCRVRAPTAVDRKQTAETQELPFALSPPQVRAAALTRKLYHKPKRPALITMTREAAHYAPDVVRHHAEIAHLATKSSPGRGSRGKEDGAAIEGDKPGTGIRLAIRSHARMERNGVVAAGCNTSVGASEPGKRLRRLKSPGLLQRAAFSAEAETSAIIQPTHLVNRGHQASSREVRLAERQGCPAPNLRVKVMDRFAAASIGDGLPERPTVSKCAAVAE